MGLCFFQAEDGIRDLVRSRGLGDVYKRQGVLIRASDENGYIIKIYIMILIESLERIQIPIVFKVGCH